MASKEMAYQYRLAQWSALTKERAELGMSIRAYCAMKGFAENTYFYWQRRLRDAACAHLETEQIKLPAAGFAQVALTAPVSESSEAQADQLHIEISGIRLSVDSGYPPEKLVALLRELSSSC